MGKGAGDGCRPALVVPGDYFDATAADEEFQAERAAAVELGMQTGLHNPIEERKTVQSLHRIQNGQLLYRGWMLNEMEYTQLSSMSDSRLVTSPEQYARAHYIPGWYDAFKDITPHAVWGSPEEAQTLLTSFTGPCIVKDYVKSMKAYWDEACFIPDATDTHIAMQVIDRFLELRSDELQGGIVLKEFEELGDEVRTWWTNGNHALTTPHPDTPDVVFDVPIETIAPSVKQLDCPFISVDVAKTPSGYRVVEVGDGGVSGLPRGYDPVAFLQTITDGLADN